MLSEAYNELFGQLLQQKVSLDTLLQLWLTLNEESGMENSPDSQPQFVALRYITVILVRHYVS